jgi:hypothetical protein
MDFSVKMTFPPQLEKLKIAAGISVMLCITMYPFTVLVQMGWAVGVSGM